MTADSTLSSPAAAPGADYAATASEAYRAALQVIESVEPRIAAATRKELADQRDSLKLIASENYASPAVLLTMGTWLSDKYAEGTVGHRFYAGCQNVDDGREHRRRARPRALRRPLRLRPAALRHRRQPGGVLGHPGHQGRGPRAERCRREERQRPVRGGLGAAARQARQPAADGHVAGRRRPPHPRLPAQHLRQDVPAAQLRHRPGDRPARLRRRGRRRPRVQAADPGGRLLGLSAAGQLRQDARDRRRGRRHPDGRHGALRRSGGRQGVHRRRGPGAARPRRHHHHAQVAARPARRSGAGHRRVLAMPSTRAARWCSAARCRT